MTYDFSINECVFQRNPSTRFKSNYLEEEKDELILLCKKVFNRNFSNEKGVRLDYCRRSEQTTQIGLSEVFFYDFLLSNFTLFNIEKLQRVATKSQMKLLIRLKDRFNSDGRPTDVDSILNRDYLANTLAVSLLIGDSQGRFLLTKRNGSVGISNGFASVSVTGAIDARDYEANNPFVACCQRELREELNYAIEDSAIKPFMIVCGEKKLQPIVLVNAKVDDIAEIVQSIANYRDFSIENSGLFICDKMELENLLMDERTQITEAARTHLKSIFEK